MDRTEILLDAAMYKNAHATVTNHELDMAWLKAWAAVSPMLYLAAIVESSGG